MSKIESARKAAGAQNVEAISSATSPATSTADIAGLTQKVEGLTTEIIGLRGQMTLMQATAEATQTRVVSINGWVVYIGRWVEVVKEHGLHVPHLTETMQFLRVISRTLQTANLGPNRAVMQEMIAPTVEVAKRIGKETRNALRVSGWNTYRISFATAAGIVLIQTAVLIAARAAGKL